MPGERVVGAAVLAKSRGRYDIVGLYRLEAVESGGPDYAWK